jgi:hypothetical protein
MSSETILRWTLAGWAPAAADAAGGGAGIARPAGHRVLAADSFLVDAGRVLALDVHRQRFLASLRLQSAAVPDPVAFLDAAVAALPREGAWFPRVEALRGPDGDVARLLLRPAPERTATVVLRDHDGPDPRTRPRVKGPDLHALGALRSRAARHGAGEAVILAGDGTIAEGAYSAILWWHGDASAIVPSRSWRATCPGSRASPSAASWRSRRPSASTCCTSGRDPPTSTGGRCGP